MSETNRRQGQAYRGRQRRHCNNGNQQQQRPDQRSDQRYGRTDHRKDQRPDQRPDHRPKPRHRNRYQRKGNETNKPLSAVDQQLLLLSKTFKIASTSYYNAAIQENLLQSCWNRRITPKGVKISKTCKAFKKAESDIEKDFRNILQDAQENLHCSLMQHLNKVAEKSKQAINTTEHDMSLAAERANTTEVITHERFLSSTRSNINKFRELKHHRACNKMNEMTGRRERFRGSEFYRLVRPTILDSPQQYPMGAIPPENNSVTPRTPNPVPNPPTRVIPPTITLIPEHTSDPTPRVNPATLNPALPPKQNSVNDHPPHVNHSVNDHPLHVNRPARAIPSLQNPSTTIPSSSSVALTPNLGSTVSHPNACVNVSTDNPPPRKKKLPPGHSKGKMQQRDDTKESREDPISNGSIQTDTPAEEETTVVEVTPPPSPETRTGNEMIPENVAAE